MSIDLSNLSIKDLKTLIVAAKKEHTRLSKRAPITAVREKLAKVASIEGYTLAELFGSTAATRMPRADVAPVAKEAVAVIKRGRKPGAAKAGRKLGKVLPKYRNPADPKETWTGRGKQPRWMATLVAKGRKPEEFLIKGAVAKKK
ncbi:MAG: H-NS histone family protein [Xanthomonadaceae bacterium]|jgi:DNA-binding protein H-NS|nr:H-NS histone family protein [Xanthomonadaceae bacterium]